MGSDFSSGFGSRLVIPFQSTPPAWGATYNRSRETRQKIISIHAPRMGSDGLYQSHRFRQWHFNPRPPHGERRSLERGVWIDSRISIHAPRMGSDVASSTSAKHGFTISIHAPRMGSDRHISRNICARLNFNPRPPHGERRR